MTGEWLCNSSLAYLLCQSRKYTWLILLARKCSDAPTTFTNGSPIGQLACGPNDARRATNTRKALERMALDTSGFEG